jgi:enoyl-CoA hydratase
LTRLIGKGRALELCVTGRSISAETALAFGLVNEVVSEDILLKRAQTILQEILSLAPLAVQNVIEVIQAGDDLSFAEALQLEATHFGLLCATHDKNEGVRAFIDKRSANFKGN